MSQVLDQIQMMSAVPSDPDEFKAWINGTDSLSFLAANATERETVVLASTNHVFIHGVLVPAASLDPLDREGLLNWNFNAYSTWGVSYRPSDPSSISISPPLDDTGSKTFNRGELLVFARSFEGRLGEKHYFEILQKFVHVSNLHFLHERDAYCRLDERGDIEEVIRILTLPTDENSPSGSIITFERGILHEYMALTDSVLVLTFDFTRFNPSHFSGWGEGQESVNLGGDLYYRHRIEGDVGSYIRGCQVIHPMFTKADVHNRHDRPRRQGRQHASYIAFDWKHGIVREISCAPDAIANYFTKSDLPFETTPAFFRPDVLLKYKADSEKYRLRERSISCRGTWHLQTYDINEAGQVHTYLVYLSHLPYEEQLHWKAYNEAPKGSISKRAFTTDFEGRWDLDYEPLESLKAFARGATQKRLAWWSLRSEQLIHRVHYPVSPSADEWANELLTLDQLIVEGLQEKWLRQRAVILGRSPGNNLRSLKLVEECLIGMGVDENNAREITAPLHKLHDLRSKLKGHAAGEEALKLKREALAQHKSYKTHFQRLCAECDQAIRAIQEAFASPDKNAPAAQTT